MEVPVDAQHQAPRAPAHSVSAKSMAERCPELPGAPRAVQAQLERKVSPAPQPVTVRQAPQRRAKRARWAPRSLAV
jgi:hypothetical protein